MRCGIDAVWCNIDFDNRVIFNVIVFGGGCAHFHARGQHNNAVVRCAHANLVFGANHTERLLSANLRFLDYKLFVTVVKHCANGGYNHFLSCGNIRRAAYNCQQFGAAHVNGCNVQVVGIGVVDAGFHFANHKAFQSAFN